MIFWIFFFLNNDKTSIFLQCEEELAIFCSSHLHRAQGDGSVPVKKACLFAKLEKFEYQIFKMRNEF